MPTALSLAIDQGIPQNPMSGGRLIRLPGLNHLSSGMTGNKRP